MTARDVGRRSAAHIALPLSAAGMQAVLDLESTRVRLARTCRPAAVDDVMAEVERRQGLGMRELHALQSVEQDIVLGRWQP